MKKTTVFLLAAILLVFSNQAMLLSSAEVLDKYFDCLGNNDLSCAEKIVNEETKTNPQAPFSWLLKAELEKAKGNEEAALEAYGKAVELDPGFRDAYVQRAVHYFDLSRFEEGLMDFRRVQAMNPEDFKENMNLGAALVRMKRYREAIPYLEKALTLEPSDTLAKVNLATACDALPDLRNRAEKLWQEISAENPEAYKLYRSAPESLIEPSGEATAQNDSQVPAAVELPQ